MVDWCVCFVFAVAAVKWWLFILPKTWSRNDWLLGLFVSNRQVKASQLVACSISDSRTPLWGFNGPQRAVSQLAFACLLVWGIAADGQVKYIMGAVDWGVWIGKQLQEQSTCTNHRNRGRTSADRSTEATLMLTVPRSLIKSSTKDLTWPSLEIVFRQLVL